VEGFPALAGVDLDVETGEVVHICGPNGAGKTTLLRACAGLAALAAGTIEVLGCELSNPGTSRDSRRALRRRVGLLGHANALYEDLSCSENVTFFVRAAAADPGAVGPALARLGLDGRLRDVPVAKLSAGQRRRVALAVLVARQPELWLLDEPHAGLDAEGRAVVDAVLADAVTASATVLFASHEAERAAFVATRTVRMAGGVVLSSHKEPARVA